MDAARHIVATLICRKRRARRLVKRMEAQGVPDAVLNQYRAAETEAHNAAEVARRILYHGVAAV